MSKLTLFALTAVITLFSLSSCKKYCGPIHNLDDPATQCRVTRLRVLSINSPNRYAISYNAAGNPISLLVDSVNPNGKVGNLDHYYRYDHAGRLSDQITTGIQSPLAVEWHKYVYAQPDLIIDTILHFNVEDPSTQPDVTAPTPAAASAFSYIIVNFTLDTQGRVISAQSPTQTRTFTYDANGNRVLPNANLTYDDKVNPYRTNKVWQFLNFDYSRNNVIKPALAYPNVYNDLGLPTDLNALANFDDNIFLFGVNNFAPNIDITYACSAPKGPINY